MAGIGIGIAIAIGSRFFVLAVEVEKPISDSDPDSDVFLDAAVWLLFSGDFGAHQVPRAVFPIAP